MVDYAGDPKVVIGVLDTGFPANYPDFASSCSNRSITIQPINNPNDGDHGLWVSSVAAACTNTGMGMSGVDQLSTVLAASVPYNKGFAPEDYQEGFKWLRNLQQYKINNKPAAHIINLSLGAREFINVRFGYFAGEAVKNNIIFVSARK